MLKSYAYRNVALCTKDCLCLFVCPTGATDTEDSIIDKKKCIGCGACAEACPSKAITMIPTEYPPQQQHHDDVTKAMTLLLQSKSNQESISSTLPNKLAVAMEKSNRIMAEDIARECGYMLPQSKNAALLLRKIVASSTEQKTKDAATKLLAMLNFNEEIPEDKAESWQCSICKYVHEGELTEGFVCPICKQPASVFVKL